MSEDAPPQLSLAEARNMPGDELTRALRNGQLRELLAGRDPGTEPEPDFTPPGDADQGARGHRYATRRDWLRSLPPERVRQMLRDGDLDDVLRRGDQW